VLLEEKLDAFGILQAHRPRTLHRNAVVEARLADIYAELGGLLHFLRDRGRLEQCLRRDAAPENARSAERFALDYCDGHSELGCANGADISRRAAAYENHVKTCHGNFPLIERELQHANR